MRIRCQRFSREMADFTTLLNLNQGDQNSEEKLELVKMFVEFLKSNKCDHKHVMHKHGHGHYGMFGRFGKRGHGRHHGRHSPSSHHGGPHHGYRGLHGPHHHGHHGHYGHHHHPHGFHGHNGKFKTQVIIDLTQEDQECTRDQNDQNGSIPNNQTNVSTSSNQRLRGVTNCTKCKCIGDSRRQCKRSGRWMLCPYKRNNTDTQDISCQTEEPMNEDNNEQPQENLSAMVENINIENNE